MVIDIIGAGSLGMLLAGRLGAAGTAVRAVARTRSQAERITAEGLNVLQTDGSAECAYAPCAAHFEQYGRDGWEAPDWIFITVKQKDLTPGLLAAVLRGMEDRTGVVAFQNGLGHMLELSRAFGSHRIFAAVTTEGAKRISPSEVVHTGRGWIKLGAPYSTDCDQAGRRLDPGPLVHELAKAGFLAELSDRIECEQWNKLLINAVINPLTSVLGITNGELLRSAELRRLMAELYAEGLSVALKRNIPVAADLWDQILQVCEETSANRSSMLQDVEAGRLTEIDWINGSILREAEALGLSLPVNRTVVGLVKGLEAGLSARHRKL